MARKKGGGGKLNRSEIIQARLDPKLHMAAEIMARAERRTLSSFIERSIEQMAKTLKVKRNLFNTWMSPDYEIFTQDKLYSHFDRVTVEEAVKDIHGNHEAISFFKFASYFPELLTRDEEELFRTIISIPYFWMYYPINTEDQKGRIIHTSWAQVNAVEGLVYDHLIEYWDSLKSKEIEIEYLENLPVGKEISAPLKQDLKAIKKYIETDDPSKPYKIIYAWNKNPAFEISSDDFFWKKNAQKLVTQKIEIRQTAEGPQIVTVLVPPSNKEDQKAWLQFYKNKMEEINNGN